MSGIVKSSGLHIGVLGGGQLGQMLGLAGIGLGHRFSFLDPAEQPPAAQVGRHIRAEYDDPEALERLVRECDLITLEFENVPEATARWIDQHAEIAPTPQALAIAQDRLTEKLFFQQQGLAVAPFVALDTVEQAQSAFAEINGPGILKTRRLGYDGKGQVRFEDSAAVSAGFEQLGRVQCILEGMVDFEREVSMVCARRADGQMVFYPLTENEHHSGILYQSRVLTDDPLQQPAQSACRAVADALDYVGVFAIEFFVRNGELLVNEMAPRVHNSGHWSLGGAVCSQFENHLRAILGWPLGSTEPHSAALMRNLVGAMPQPSTVLQLPGVLLQDYGKSARAGRKLGHITLLAADQTALDAQSEKLEQALADTPFG